LERDSVHQVFLSEFTDHLVKTHTRVSVQRTQAPAVATT
jgi:hypothetical protein